MTVEELKKELDKYDDDMDVVMYEHFTENPKLHKKGIESNIKLVNKQMCFGEIEKVAIHNY